jgi:hypothetical protein
MKQLLVTDVRCPYCMSSMYHRTARHGFGDFLRQLLGIYPWYCNRCSTRYYKWKRSALPLNSA